MKKIIFCLLFALSYVFADENEILKEKLECFYSDFVSKTMTEHQLIEEYGNPTDIEIIQIGDRGDYIKVYDYEQIGWYRFYYKSDEKKTFIISCCLKSLAINNLNIPKTIEGLNSYFNHKFRMSIYDNNKVLLGYHGDEFEFNFIFNDDLLDMLFWAIILD